LLSYTLKKLKLFIDLLVYLNDYRLEINGTMSGPVLQFVVVSYFTPLDGQIAIFVIALMF
jgi:hypothetical protein